MTDKKFVPEHYQVHTITEVWHIPGHDQRVETATFRNAKRELEKVEHIPCFVCGTLEHRESHHIIERCEDGQIDFHRMATLLFNFRDYHGHCHRDFKSADELASFLATHEKEAEAFDCIYNQVILCERHHRGEGTSMHGSSAAGFDAQFCAKDGVRVLLSEKEYDELLKKEASA